MNEVIFTALFAALIVLIPIGLVAIDHLVEEMRDRA
jgi:hypothetical protein